MERFSRFCRLLPCALLSLWILTACSSGESSSSASLGSDDGTQGTITQSGGEATSSWTILPVADQANTIGLQLARSDDGVLHASYADIDGRVFYARCSSQNLCAQSSGWQSIVIEQYEVGASGYVVPRLELDRQSQPRIASYYSSSSFSNGTVYFASCDVACMSTASWQSGEVIRFNDGALEFRVANTDWFAIDPSGNPVLSLFLNDGLLVNLDPSLRIISCEQNCISGTNWQQNIVSTIPLQLGRAVEIKISDSGEYHLVLLQEGIGADVATVTWFGCNLNCRSAGNWTQGISLQAVDADFDSLADVALAVSPSSQPFVLVYDDTDQTSLTLHSCAQSCTQPSSWVQYTLDNRVDLDAALFDIGYGVDARFNGASLEVAFAVKAADSGLRERLVSATCDSNCQSSAASWTSQFVANTMGDVGAQPGCVFIGTGIRSAVSLVDNAIGFTANPQWACGGQVVERTDQFGEITFDYLGDIFFLEMGSVATY